MLTSAGVVVNQEDASMVVGVDFSAGSHWAVRYALAVAVRKGYAVHFVHVRSDPAGDGGERSTDQIRDQLAEFVGGPERPGARLAFVVLEGEVAERLVDYAVDLGAECVVLGAAGWGGGTCECGSGECGSVCRACRDRRAIPVRVVRTSANAPFEVSIL